MYLYMHLRTYEFVNNLSGKWRLYYIYINVAQTVCNGI